MKKIIFQVLAVFSLLVCGKSAALETFNLATFNIRCPVDRTPNTWDERKARCLAVIQQNKFDIFGVQEAYRKQLDDLLGSEFAFVGGGRADFKNKGEFSAIIYRKTRFELIDGGTFGLSEKPQTPGVKSWKSACPRIVTWGIFLDKKTGKKFIYYNTHLDHKSELARVNGIKLIVEHSRKNIVGIPIVLTGDFNAKPDSETYKIAKTLLKDAAEVTRTPHSGPMQTYHAYGRSKRNVPIDYIFVSEGIQVLSHKTDDTKFPEGFPSDHFPVVATLRIR